MTRKKPERSDLRTRELVTSIAAALRFAKDRHFEAYRIKTQVPIELLFDVLGQVTKSHRIFEFAHGDPLPRTIADLFSKPALYKRAPLLSELIWSICRCISQGTVLRTFSETRLNLELAVLNDDRPSAEHILAEHEARAGQSLWLIQSRLSLARHWSGISELRSITRGLLDEKPNELAHLLLFFMSRRIEATSTAESIRSDLAAAVKWIESEELRSYLESKLLLLSDLPNINISGLLLVDAQSSLVDHYESLTLAMQSLCSAPIPDDVRSALRRPIGTLYELTRDRRLRPVCRALGIGLSNAPDLARERTAAIEAYSKGSYAQAAEFAQAHCKAHPEDMSIFLLRHKIAAKLKIPYLVEHGILGQLSRNYASILKMDDSSYTGAHELLQLHNIFLGQQWIHYVKAAVMYELQTESTDLPATWLRDIFARDWGLSPFTAFLLPESERKQFLQAAELKQTFPTTSAIFNSLAFGTPPTLDDAVPSTSALKFLARHMLATGQPKSASAAYAQLKDQGCGAERIRASAGITLAEIALGNLEGAAVELVRTYLDAPHVPTLLPIDELVKAMGKPADWPDNIATPIVFSLYSEFLATDKLAELRFSFEKFQLSNRIASPAAMQALDAPKDFVIYYLRNVWRPEVMRQTLLYSGSKDIEESRIRVCQVLAEIDPDREEVYLDEIKDRVKKLAIADGVKLVEQSKVYVDIPAIKREILRKLESPYKRYKSVQFAAGVSDSDASAENLIEAISQAVGVADAAKALSSMHLVGRKTTEDDAQFDAMYAEVMSEFLHGAHGLNAYLSTRVRHGVLSNLLRKPAEVECLATAKSEAGEDYLPNGLWNDGYSTDSPVLETIFSEFSRAFDSVLDDLRDNLLQIRSTGPIKVSGSERALFIYGSSNVERLLLKAKDRQGKDLDQFIDRCVDHLWQKTDENLHSVQLELLGSVKQRLLRPYDDLAVGIEALPLWPKKHELLRAISRARTETQSLLIGPVVSWFQRSEVYDRPDYPPEFLVEVAHSMIRNTIASAANWLNVRVACAPTSKAMPGRTFDALVYAFYGLFENAIKRAKLDINKLEVEVQIEFDGGKFSANITNNVAPDQITEEDHAKLDRVREKIRSGDSTKAAQSEGLSGLTKIWHAINGPFYASPALEFSLSEQAFEVKLSFRLDSQ